MENLVGLRRWHGDAEGGDLSSDIVVWLCGCVDAAIIIRRIILENLFGQCGLYKIIQDYIVRLYW